MQSTPERSQAAWRSGLLIVGLAIIAAVAHRWRPPPATPPPAIPPTIWQLRHVLIDGERQRPPAFFAFSSLPQIQFVSQTEFIGYDGCNSFRGAYTASARDGTVHVSDYRRTSLECPFVVLTEDNTRLDPEFLQALFSAVRYELTEDRNELRLYYPESSSHSLILRPLSGGPFRYQTFPALP